MAISKVCKEAIWLSNFYVELCGDSSCTTTFCNSQSAICLTKDQMLHGRRKHINVIYHFMQDVIVEGKIQVPKISTHENPYFGIYHIFLFKVCVCASVLRLKKLPIKIQN